jgi:hypothetical protein
MFGPRARQVDIADGLVAVIVAGVIAAARQKDLLELPHFFLADAGSGADVTHGAKKTITNPGNVRIVALIYMHLGSAL